MSIDLRDLGSLSIDNTKSSGAMIIDINLIDEDPNQPRTEFDKETLQELADTIAERGVKSPISVHRTEGGRFMINHGARRYRASILAGKTTIPAFIDDDYTQADQIIENIQRDNLKPIEIAKYIEAEKAKGLSQKEIATQLGKGQKYISDMLSLLSLYPPIQELFDANKFDGVAPVTELNRLYKQDQTKVDLWLQEITPDETITLKDVRKLAQIIKNSDAFSEVTALPNIKKTDDPTALTDAELEDLELLEEDDLPDESDNTPSDNTPEATQTKPEKIFKTVKEIRCSSEKYGTVTIVFKEAEEGKLYVLTDEGVKDIAINELRLERVIF